jgi:hypothetical protein
METILDAQLFVVRERDIDLACYLKFAALKRLFINPSHTFVLYRNFKLNVAIASSAAKCFYCNC